MTVLDPVVAGSRRAKTRQALIDAGFRLLAQRPLDAISIDDFAREAGVAKGSFYNHFDDKEALAHALASAARFDIERAVGEANRGVEDPARRVARALCVVVQQAIADPERASVLLTVTAQAPFASAPVNKGVLDDVSAGLVSGRFAVPTAEAGVLFILGVAQLALARALNEPSAPTTVMLTQQLCALLLRGFGLPALDADALAARAVHEIIEATARE